MKHDPFRGLPHEPRRPRLLERLRYWRLMGFDPPLSLAEKGLVIGFAIAAGIAGFAFRLALDGKL